MSVAESASRDSFNALKERFESHEQSNEKEYSLLWKVVNKLREGWVPYWVMIAATVLCSALTGVSVALAMVSK